jgi:hypothetical protein
VKDALNGNDNIVTRGRNGLEQGIWTSFHVPMHHNLAVLGENADIHGTGMQIDAAVKWVLFGVEAHEVSSSCE